MNRYSHGLKTLVVFAMAFSVAASSAVRARAADKAGRPAIGDAARDFTLKTVDGDSVTLAKLTKSGPVVLIVLRGYPGYQCPVCNVQVGQFLAAAGKFKSAQANVLLVYPGSAEGLKAHAAEFVRGKTLPDNFYLLLDPDFGFTTAYGLRWDAKNETAYPSTFVIDTSGKIQFAKISMTHGDRASAGEVLKAVTGK